MYFLHFPFPLSQSLCVFVLCVCTSCTR